MSYKFAMSLPVILIAFLGVVSDGQPDDIKTNTSEEYEAIVFNIHSGEILAAQSEIGLTEPLPVGSLAKPLVSYALIASGKSSNNVFFCRSSTPDEKSTESCWYKPGHGNLTFKQALAQSCNAWFRQWLKDKNSEAALKLVERFGLIDRDKASNSLLTNLQLCGLEGNLPIYGLNCAAAFATLFNGGVVMSVNASSNGKKIVPIGTMRIDTNALEIVASGMRECGATGTGREFGEVLGPGMALVKTGTAYSVSGNSIDETATDGWCVALYPANSPEVLVFLHLPGGTGSSAAKHAAILLKQILEPGQ